MRTKPDYNKLCHKCSSFEKTVFENGDARMYCNSLCIKLVSEAVECTSFSHRSLINKNIDKYSVEMAVGSIEPIIIGDKGKVSGFKKKLIE